MIRRKDIVKAISNTFSLSQIQSGKIFDKITSLMKAELMKGSDVAIPQFFTLSVKETLGRTLVVPSTGQKSEAKLYKGLRCKFSKKFRDEIKKS